MTISGGRTKQVDIFCRVTGFTSEFLSFIVVELIRFFHGALQLCVCLFLALCVSVPVCLRISVTFSGPIPLGKV